jgi:2-polyprenyl-6-hydroxyphenyl methylase/3-demethylubiquinone-9 3-methyltransferase
MKSQLVVSRRCPVCDSARFAKLRFCKNPADPFWRKCKNCKSIYAKDIPDSKTISQHYESYYDGINLEIPEFVRSNLDKRMESLNGYRTELNNILDIGFGAGIFLEVAQDQGWNCFGTEYSPDSIRIATSKGWTVHKGDLDEGDLSGPFDVVAAIEVLEHVSSPATIVKLAKQRLRKHGAFYGTTPNSQSLNVKILGENWSVLCFPEHQVLLNKKSMKLVFKLENFETKMLRSTGFNPIDIFNSIRTINRKNSSSKIFKINRVDGGYAINSVFESRSFLSYFKKTINQVLTILGIGDSLNFLAEKDD